MFTTSPIADLKSYVIDPQVDGLASTAISIESGSPTVSNGAYVLNNAKIRTGAQYLYGEVDMRVVIPSQPNTGDFRLFGFQGISVGDRGALYFKVDGDNFSANAYSHDGTLLFTKDIEWNAAWTNTPISLIISYQDTNAIFIVRTSAGAADTFSVAFNLAQKQNLETRVVDISNYVVIENQVSDNLQVKFIALNNVQRASTTEEMFGTVPPGASGSPTVNYKMASGSIDAINTGIDNSVFYSEGVETGYGQYDVTDGVLITRGAFRYGTIRFLASIGSAPAPTNGHFVGFVNYPNFSLGKGYATFGWVGGDVYARAYDDNGGLIINEAFTWDAGWTGVLTTFEIKRTNKSITFTITNANHTEVKTANFTPNTFAQSTNYGMQFNDGVTVAMLGIELVNVEATSIYDAIGHDGGHIVGGKSPQLKADVMLAGVTNPLAVALVDTGGQHVNPGDTTQYATIIDEASATITYVGYANTGALTSQGTWRIKRIDTTSGLVIKWADGNSFFDNVWDDRASLSYS